MAASRCVRCMQCLCWGFVLGRHGQFGESFLSDKQRDRKHPFSFPQCRQGNMDRIDSAGRTRVGGGGCEQMCTLHAVVVLWVCLGETWTVVETFLNTS